MSARLIPGSDYDEVAWRALSFFSGYRFIISLIFVALVWLTDLPEPLGAFDDRLFALVTQAYFLAALLLFVPLRLRLPGFGYQVAGQVFIDIFAITLIMYASAGVSSGFGMLLMIAVAGGSLLKPGKIAYFFAALATLAVLGEELYAHLVRFFPAPNYTHAAVLGSTFFIVAFIGHKLALRVRESEQLAASRAIDIQNLAALNAQIVQHMQSGVLVIDADNSIRLANSSARKLLGARQELAGQPVTSVCPELNWFIEQCRSQGEQAPVVIRPSTAAVDVQASFRPLNPGGDAGLLVFLEDASGVPSR